MKTKSAFSVSMLLLSMGLSFNLFANTPSFAPIRSDGAGPRFFLDYINLKGIDNLTFIEFYIQVSYDQLQFIRDGAGFKAGYELNFLIHDTEDRIVDRHSNVDEIKVRTFDETKARDKARVSQVGFSLQPKSYRILVTITDLETLHTSVIEKELEARNFESDTLMVSDIQLSTKITPAENGQPYVKNQRYVAPNVLRTFALEHSDLHLYFEVYNLKYSPENSGSTYTTYFIFKDSEGNPVAKFRRTNEKPGVTSAHSLKIPLEHFRPGQYQLTIEIRDDADARVAQSSETFMVLDQDFLEDTYMEAAWR